MDIRIRYQDIFTQNFQRLLGFISLSLKFKKSSLHKCVYCLFLRRVQLIPLSLEWINVVVFDAKFQNRLLQARTSKVDET